MVISPKERARFPVSSLSADLPQTPEFPGEDKLDVQGIAQDFLSRFGAATEAGDWEGWKSMWADDAWWRDSLTLTWDRRTLHGSAAIARAWSDLSASRNPGKWSLDTAPTGLPLAGPAWVRLAPTLASLEVGFSFTLDRPSSICVGMFKLIPNITLEAHADGHRAIQWKIWILSTWMVSLAHHPFAPLPQADDVTSRSLVSAAQRGHPEAQGLPRLAEDAVFDAVVVGFSSCGMANTIALESIGLQAIAFDLEPSAGGFWDTGRYEDVRLHHPKRMIQLPLYPPGEKYPKFMTGHQLARYYAEAVRDLRLPMFAGIKVLSNLWDEPSGLWTSTIQDVRTGEKATIRSKNLVLSNGFLYGGVNLPGLTGRDNFKGTVQHSSEVTTSELYTGKRVLVVGSSTSAHDIAGQICRSGMAKSVSILQRSPTVLLEFEEICSKMCARYEGDLPVDTADMLDNSLPTAISRMFAMGFFAMLMANAEEANQKFERHGYLVARSADIVSLALEARGRSLYADQPGNFDLVFADKIKIERGQATGLAPDGVITQYQDETKVIPCDAVILATGYKNYDLPGRYAKSGFLDPQSASGLANPGECGTDKEGEWVGYITQSGHPNLFFAAIALIHSRFIAKFVAIQVMANVTGKTPAVYPRE